MANGALSDGATEFDVFGDVVGAPLTAHRAPLIDATRSRPLG
jgi:hypothetical protein